MNSQDYFLLKAMTGWQDVELMAIVATKADLYNPFVTENGRVSDAIDRVIAHLEVELGISIVP